ncbi:MAG: hypothetical protein ACRENU_14255 [Gemmatimonadaceae bacterium]
MIHPQRGFALLTVLWVMVAASVVALAGALAAREGVSAATNRADAERALWRAHDCIERARLAVDEALIEAQRSGDILRGWRHLDQAALTTRIPTDQACEVRMHAAGSKLDINRATAEQLTTLFQSLEVADAATVATRVIEARSEPFADVRQVQRLSGVSYTTLAEVMDVEAGRIVLTLASPAVLAAVPGLTPEAAARIGLERDMGRDVTDIMMVARFLSRASADSIAAHYPEIVRMTTADPDAWIVTARGWAGSPPLSVFIDARLGLALSGAVVSRWRSWQ